MDTAFNIIGLIGMLLLLGAFFLQQKHMVSGQDPAYLWLNLLGSIAIIASLLRFWNLASFLLDVAWALISIYGLLQHHKAKRA